MNIHVCGILGMQVAVKYVRKDKQSAWIQVSHSVIKITDIFSEFNSCIAYVISCHFINGRFYLISPLSDMTVMITYAMTMLYTL